MNIFNVKIQSIRAKYPTIRVIVADDSINYKEISYDLVTQYKMPPAAGFNKGKSLAVSQVGTFLGSKAIQCWNQVKALFVNHKLAKSHLSLSY